MTTGGGRTERSEGEARIGAAIGSAQGNPYWHPDDHWTQADADEAVALFEEIANGKA